jgi:hypothetical protein
MSNLYPHKKTDTNIILPLSNLFSTPVLIKETFFLITIIPLFMSSATPSAFFGQIILLFSYLQNLRIS